MGGCPARLPEAPSAYNMNPWPNSARHAVGACKSSRIVGSSAPGQNQSINKYLFAQHTLHLVQGSRSARAPHRLLKNWRIPHVQPLYCLKPRGCNALGKFSIKVVNFQPINVNAYYRRAPIRLLETKV